MVCFCLCQTHFWLLYLTFSLSRGVSNAHTKSLFGFLSHMHSEGTVLLNLFFQNIQVYQVFAAHTHLKRSG